MQPGRIERPHYERPADLEGEDRIAARLITRWKLTDCKKLNPVVYSLDFALLRGRTVAAYAEIKSRPGLPLGFRDGYYIAQSKVMKADLLTATSGLRCFMVIEFTTAIAWADFAGRSPGTIWAGRTDRADPLDEEPHCVYPWACFTKLGE